MNRNPIQSQLPEFGTSSMTSERLYQHPVKQKQEPINFLPAFIVAWLLVLSFLFIHQADKEADYQVQAIAQAVTTEDAE